VTTDANTDANIDESDVVDDVTTDDQTDEQATDDQLAPPGSGGGSRRLRGQWGKFGAILLVLALVASAGAAAWLYFFWYRPDQQTNPAAADSAKKAAEDGTVAVLTYSPESVEQDFANAKTHLTGDFLNHYTGFTEQIVLPAAKQKSVKTSAAVVQAAVSEIKPDSAVVLVFVNQTTTSKENPDGAFAASAVRVTLQKTDDRWLISEFEPV
jgi:Mce-associated membrane protein